MQQVQAHIGGVKICRNYLTRAQKIAEIGQNDINPIQTLLNLICGRQIDEQVDSLFALMQSAYLFDFLRFSN